MAALPDSKYHLREQQADALIAPVHATLAEMERRVQHFLVHMRLGEADANALNAAHDVLADATARIAQVLTESRAISHE
jgi:hypothetical protein